MQISYDETADALYIAIADLIVDRTAEIDQGTLVDIDRSGRLIGIEVIRPARKWPLDRILQDYDIADEDAQALHALWKEGEEMLYPFTRQPVAS